MQRRSFIQPTGGAAATLPFPTVFAQFILSETAKWAKVVKEADVRIES